MLIDQKTERLVLCALLERPRLRNLIIPYLQDNFFGDISTRRIWDRICFFMREGEELPSAGTMSMDPGLDDASRALLVLNDRDYRHKVASFRKEDAKQCLKNLQYFYKKRVLHEMNKWCTTQLASSTRVDMDEMVAKVQEHLSEATTYDNPSDNVVTYGMEGNVTDEHLRELVSTKKQRIIKTGIDCIDKRTQWARGNMILMTAFPGGGKSALAKSLSWSHFKQGHRVYVVNLEMEDWEYEARMWAEIAPDNVSYERIREGFEKNEHIGWFLAEKRKIDKLGYDLNAWWTLRTVNTANYTPAMLHQELKYKAYDVVVIDYVNLFKRTKRDLWDSIYEHTKYLKMMAKDLNVLIYVLGQLNKEGDAKYAGAAKEDADVWLKWELLSGQSEVLLVHGKARHYRKRAIKMIFDGRKQKFCDPNSLTQAQKTKIQISAEKYAEEQRLLEEKLEIDRKRYETKQRGGGGVQSSSSKKKKEEPVTDADIDEKRKQIMNKGK